MGSSTVVTLSFNLSKKSTLYFLKKKIIKYSLLLESEFYDYMWPTDDGLSGTFEDCVVQASRDAS